MTLLLRRYGGAMLAWADDPAAMLALIRKVGALEPPQTRRVEVQQRFQQFSTSLELAWIVAAVADVQPNDIVLELSAGTRNACRARLAQARRRQRPGRPQRVDEHARGTAAAGVPPVASPATTRRASATCCLTCGRPSS